MADALETALLDRLAAAPPADRLALRRLKLELAARTGGPLVRNDALLARYRDEVSAGRRRPDERLERRLRLNAVRSESGIATITVITEPYACPGRCVYCPTEARAPKSYLTNEPAVQRALRVNYDPAGQVRTRLSTLAATGHATDKLDLIIKGGTWSFYPPGYQEEFIRRCVEAANAFGRGEGPGAVGRGDGLDDVFRENETAACRVIGITIETRPDYVNAAEVPRLRRLGVTRVELGVQSLEEEVLAAVVRDHGTEAVRRATALLKDAGFKVAYHLMPNLPGATPASDLAGFRTLFEDPAYRPDALKLYPCVVIETAELYEWWLAGRYAPYDDATLCDLLGRMKTATPPYVRIERIIRDIPSTSIRGGCRVTNLREAVQARLRAQGWSCRCIRCRQVRGSADGAYRLTRRDYRASGGTEVFLSYEDPDTDRLAALLRLRVPSQEASWTPALAGAALVRELHTYGQHVPLRGREADAAQHRGFGGALLREAERITREDFGRRRIAVIAGVGVREYYRRAGYTLSETYMIKELVD